MAWVELEWTHSGRAFILAVLINFVERLGDSFIAPVLVPYGQVLGASDQTIALFTLLRGLGSILSVIWLPLASDYLGRDYPLIMLSLGFTSLAYALVACSHFLSNAPHQAIVMVCVGRTIGGLFSGVQPLLRAQLAEMSSHDDTERTNRLIAMGLAAQVAGVLLAPVSGYLAETVSIVAPFWVMSASAVFILLCVLAFYLEAHEVIERDGLPHEVCERERVPEVCEPDTLSQARSGKIFEFAFPVRRRATDHRHPAADPALWIIGFAALCGIFVLPTIQLLLPMTLMQESFGLVQQYSEQEDLQRRIADVTGMLMLSFGAFSVLSSFLYLPISRVIGEPALLFLVGLLGWPGWVSFAFAREIWHLHACCMAGGLLFGFFMPVFGPLVTKYVDVRHPHRRAMAGAVPMLGFYISMTFAQNIIASILECYQGAEARDGVLVAWSLACTACVLSGYLAGIFAVIVHYCGDDAESKSAKDLSRQASLRNVALLADLSSRSTRLARRVAGASRGNPTLQAHSLGVSLQPRPGRAVHFERSVN